MLDDRNVLDDRKLAVLRAIVEDYVSTNEPVGSKALAERHKLGVSPATIRNDMVALEELGYIAQPHTSAGRVPTDKGYRLFVDRLSKVKPLSKAERRAIETFLSGALDLDEIVSRTVRLLAHLTRQVAIMQYPSLTRSSVQHLELVPLGPQRLMLVLITNTGRVEQRVIDGLAEVSDDVVENLRGALNRALVGKWLTEAPQALSTVTAQLPADDRPMAESVLSVLMESLVEKHEEKIVFGGTANLAAMGSLPGSRRPEALEENVVLIRLLGEMGDASMLTVRIGAENATGPAVHLDCRRGTGSAIKLAKLGVVGQPGWTTQERWERLRAVAGTSVRSWQDSKWPETITRSWCSPRRDPGRVKAYAGSHVNCIPTSTPTQRPRSGSRKSPKPTRCSPTRRSAACTTWASTRSRAAGQRAAEPPASERASRSTT